MFNPLKRTDMKKNNLKKGIMLVAIAAMSTVMATAHPRPYPPPAPRAKVVAVKKAPKKVETVIVKKKDGKTVVVKKVNGRTVATKTVVRR